MSYFVSFKEIEAKFSKIKRLLIKIELATYKRFIYLLKIRIIFVIITYEFLLYILKFSFTFPTVSYKNEILY